LAYVFAADSSGGKRGGEGAGKGKGRVGEGKKGEGRGGLPPNWGVWIRQ